MRPRCEDLRDLAGLDETVRLGTRLGDGSALPLGLGTIVGWCGLDRQRDEMVILGGRGLVVRTSQDRGLPRTSTWPVVTRTELQDGQAAGKLSAPAVLRGGADLLPRGRFVLVPSVFVVLLSLRCVPDLRVFRLHHGVQRRSEIQR